MAAPASFIDSNVVGGSFSTQQIFNRLQRKKFGLGQGQRQDLRLGGTILLFVACGDSSLQLCCLIANGLFIYLCFLCMHLGMNKIILFKIF